MVLARSRTRLEDFVMCITGGTSFTQSVRLGCKLQQRQLLAALEYDSCAGTFLGCMPNNLIAVNAGNRLTELTSFADLYDFKSLLLGGSFSILSWQLNMMAGALYMQFPASTSFD